MPSAYWLYLRPDSIFDHMSDTVSARPVKEKSVYLPGLNGIRGIAALMVVLTHHADVPRYNGNKTVFNNLWLDAPVGAHGVFLFFTLSGFLITHLLLLERQKTQTIHIPNFYIRRILRIWPLYFMILLVGVLVLPHLSLFTLEGHTEYISQNKWTILSLSVFFLPNITFAIIGKVKLVFISVLWSIGIEEQFYLFWPWLVRNNYRRLKLFAIFIIMLMLSIRVGQAVYTMLWNTPVSTVANILIWTLNFDFMAMGALCAILYHEQNRHFLRLIANRYIAVGVLVIILPLILLPFPMPSIKNFVYLFPYAFIISHIAYAPRPILNLEKKPLIFLGLISYGVYLYHMIAQTVVANLLDYTPLYTQNPLLWEITYMVSYLTLAITTAWLSYLYFETPFLKYKSRFMIILSSNRKS